MAREKRSQTVFLRHDGAEKKDIYFRIAPIAVRFQQQGKSSVTETLGGYFREVMFSKDAQYNGLMLPDFTIEATTGAAYRKELKTIDWIWRHSGDRKKNGAPADTYFFDNIEDKPFQKVVRATKRAYLIHIQNFAWDDTVNSAYEIRFSMRCKILRDLFWGLEGEESGIGGNSNVPNLNTIMEGVKVGNFDPALAKNPIGDLVQRAPLKPTFTKLPL